MNRIATILIQWRLDFARNEINIFVAIIIIIIIKLYN